MADVTADFFDDLSKRGQEPLLGKMRATVRFDIADKGKTERWLLADPGRVAGRDPRRRRGRLRHPADKRGVRPARQRPPKPDGRGAARAR